CRGESALEDLANIRFAEQEWQRREHHALHRFQLYVVLHLPRFAGPSEAMTSCDETAVDDELQAFIADCEFKTRKILRESNSRARENAKVRVDIMLAFIVIHGPHCMCVQLLGAKDRLQRLKSGGPPAIVGGLLSKSSSLDLSKPRTPAKKTTPRNNDNIHNPSKPWKEKDRIIHEAAETLKALDRSSKTGHSMGHLHKSLTTSPFRSKRPAPKTKAPKSAGENAMITRRTIERDFYIMSKKRDIR
ncbi:hypothetical protein THAOC_11033, partial [Thalassiosira oceanica]